MQRTPSLPVLVHCPHHNAAVRARRNTATDRLVSCDDRETCRTPGESGDGNEPARTFPRGCPVYPSLAK